MSEAIIDVQGLCKSFPKTSSLRTMFKRERKPVLHDIDLSVRSGEIYGLLGPNGAGKTTLIKILCTLVRPSAGIARVDGHDIMKDSAKVRGRIGLVNCDDRSYYWRLSARENLRFYAALSKVPPESTDARIDELLELTGLGHVADVRLSEFSSGMKQRLAIARGMLGDPKLLFMDEPTRSLDPIGSHSLRTFIRDEIVGKDGRTVVLATNLMDEAEFLCNRISLINHGRIYATGTVEELSNTLNPDEHYELSIRGLDSEQINGLQQVPGLTQVVQEAVRDDKRQVHLYLQSGSAGLANAIRRIVEMGGEIWDCQSVDVSLDEVFRTVLGPQAATEERHDAAPEQVQAAVTT